MLTTLFNLDQTDGDAPLAGLIQTTDGSFYGTAAGGGSDRDCDGLNFTCGTVFGITTGGTLISLHGFDGNNGFFSYAALVEGTDGNLYGTTTSGGENDDCFYGENYTCGTVFSITSSGTLATLHTFVGTDGAIPYAGLVQGANGDCYGTTTYGANINSYCPYGCGTIFKITPSGVLGTVHSFIGTDGANPEAELVQATNGSFYGTTFDGGANGDGTVFTITPSGSLTILYSFCSQSNCTDGSFPYAGLVQATNGNFYGTAEGGGANSDGTVFEITPSGTLTTLHSFAGTDGAGPSAGLVQDTNGTFYGTTADGGTSNACYGGDGCGTVFSLSVGLGPFVETQPTSGAVGAAVNILGTNLTGATSVTFNGTPAVFTVDSHSLITTAVPTGATIGKVQVTVPSGTLSSNVPFRVN
jgi:uncharacterized repeat protein (TIGR03803 family)